MQNQYGINGDKVKCCHFFRKVVGFSLITEWGVCKFKLDPYDTRPFKFFQTHIKTHQDQE